MKRPWWFDTPASAVYRSRQVFFYHLWVEDLFFRNQNSLAVLGLVVVTSRLFLPLLLASHLTLRK